MSPRRKNEKYFWGTELGQRVRLASPPSVGSLPRQIGILNTSQPYKPPQPVKGIVFLFYCAIRQFRELSEVRISYSCKGLCRGRELPVLNWRIAQVCDRGRDLRCGTEVMSQHSASSSGHLAFADASTRV
jgi:hypothetical protein